MQVKWNQFVYYLREAKKNGVEEPEYHSTIEAQLQLLGWMRYKNEICHKPNLSIGNNGHIQPDILIQKDDKKQFVIEVKRPLHTQEHKVADELLNKYCLFVVRDFRNTPFHSYYLDPLHCGLIDFKRQERQVIQTTYTGIFL